MLKQLSETCKYFLDKGAIGLRYSPLERNIEVQFYNIEDMSLIMETNEFEVASRNDSDFPHEVFAFKDGVKVYAIFQDEEFINLKEDDRWVLNIHQ